MNDTTSLTIVRAVLCWYGLGLVLKLKPKRDYHSRPAQTNFEPVRFGSLFYRSMCEPSVSMSTYSRTNQD